MEGDPTTSFRKISSEMHLGIATVWRILRKDLKMYPYKPKNVQPLTEAHKAGRLEFSRWLLDQPEEFADNVLWSDEKFGRKKSDQRNKMKGIGGWWTPRLRRSAGCRGVKR